MVQRFEIERTPMAVISALGRAFLEDKKGMVFSCAISPSGTDFWVCRDNERYELPNDYKGFCGIQRKAWKNVPDYAKKICDKVVERANF